MSGRSLTYFISDLHLGARYIPDPRAHEQRVAAWLRHIAPTARRLYLLGDVLDYWYEYRTVVPRGFTRFFGALAELADSGVEITWLLGNHDIWIFGYLQQELGIKVADGPLVTELDGRRFYLAHGDGTGRMKTSFRVMRKVFRARWAQRLFAAVHPRWTVPLAHRWSSSSRCGGEGTLFDPDTNPLACFAREYLADAAHPHIDCFVFGHQHLLVDYPLPHHSRLVILGDWIRLNSYAVWDGSSLTLHLWEAKQ